MAIYFILFLIPLIAIFFPTKARKDLNFFLLFLFAILLVVIIGGRHNIGGDWNPYMVHYNETYGMTLSKAIVNNNMSDVGYMVLNWIMGQLNLGVYGVNLISGILFTTGFFAFAVRMPLPWISLVVAIPFLFVVVSLGYTRQSVAIGFEFFALIALSNYKIFRSIIIIFLGALFHKTFAILFPLVIIVGRRITFLKVFILLLLTLVSAYLLLLDYINHYILYYLENSKHSDGGFIRILMNAVPGIVYIIYYRKWGENFNLEKVWLIFSIASLVFIPLSFFASTAIDRLSLYLIPLQIYVWSHFPLIIKNNILRGISVIVIIAAYALVLLVWLNYSRYASYWVPYQNILLQ